MSSNESNKQQLYSTLSHNQTKQLQTGRHTKITHWRLNEDSS